MATSSADLFRTNRALFRDGTVFGKHHLQGAQIVASAGLGLCAVLDGTHERRHRAYKGIWNPHAVQASGEPITRIALRHELQSIRASRGIVVHQADGSFDHPFRAFETKYSVGIILPGGVAN